MYSAQVKGVGSYLCGNSQLFLDRNHTFRNRLGLHRSEGILRALFLGYPATDTSRIQTLDVIYAYLFYDDREDGPVILTSNNGVITKNGFFQP